MRLGQGRVADIGECHRNSHLRVADVDGGHKELVRCFTVATTPLAISDKTIIQDNLTNVSRLIAGNDLLGEQPVSDTRLEYDKYTLSSRRQFQDRTGHAEKGLLSPFQVGLHSGRMDSTDEAVEYQRTRSVWF